MFAGTAIAALAALGCSSPEHSGDPTKPNKPIQLKHEYKPDSVIVRFKSAPTATANAARSTLARIKGSIEDKNQDGIYDRFAHIAKGELAVVRLEKTVSVEKAIEQLRLDPAIAYAEPNWILHTSAIPNDAQFGQLYGMNNTGQTGGTPDSDIDAVEAWDKSIGSSDIVVGVVDTGIDYNHEDLAANVWTNPNEIAGNGIDDDANGVIDDVHGFNAILNNGDPLDDNAHGSHCSGTIGAVGGNGIGVAGVNHEVSIMGLKFLDAGGSGSLEDAVEAINYAVMMKAGGVNIRVLSNSWGGGGFSQALLDAITAANAADILFVAAAGNAAQDNDLVEAFPSNYDVPNVLAVAATDHNDNIAGFSSFGLTTVDLGAPGVDILSTTPGNTYSVFSGTSMATPHVSGVAALVLSANPTLTTVELKEVLMTSGDPVASLAGKTVTGKRLNASAALDEAGPPVPRFNFTASPANQVITQGESASYGLDVTSIAGFTGDVALTVSASPAFNGTLTLTPDVVATPGTATLAVATTLATAPGIYNLTITGTSGTLVKSRTVSLRVRTFGTVGITFPSTDTPITIPDGIPPGIDSIINVPQSITIEEVSVEVNITHTWIGDLLVTLTSPQGTTVVLHNREGGSADNIHKTYSLPVQFAGQEGLGDWKLHIDDNFAADGGTLDNWSLTIVGTPGAPSFTVGASPALQTVTQGDSTSYTVDIGAFSGYSQLVAVTATASPAIDAAITVSPLAVTAPGTATVTVATNCATATGTYALTITGTDVFGTSKSKVVSLQVTPFGVGLKTYPSIDTPIEIPATTTGTITSAINVTDSASIEALQVELNITHTWIGDLIVTLVAPDGNSFILHNQQGGSNDNIHQTYDVPAFIGVNTSGTWLLQVTDVFPADGGTLDNWTLKVTAAQGNVPPAPSFTYTQEFKTFQFVDTSADAGCGGSIAGRFWDFGDGVTSNEANPSHVYATAGFYTVTLTVTDNEGLSASTSQVVEAKRTPPRLSIMGVVRNPATYEYRVTLKWADALGTLVELYRNEILVDIPNNTGAKIDLFRRYETSYRWVLCEQFNDFCSNEVSIVFGELTSTSNTVKIVSKIDGVETVETVVVKDELF